MKIGFFLTLLTFLTLSCHNENVTPKIILSSPRINLSTDEEWIIEKAYSKTYMYPDNFNYEKDLDGSIYYENTVSIRTSETSWIELNTNNKQQAKAWSEISSTTSAYYRDIVAERETGKYFEFKRVYSINPKDIILSRVHKSSYFVPSLDYFRPTENIGTLKVNQIDTSTFKDFIEYVWTSSAFFSRKVIEFTITDHADKVQYNLKSLSVTYGDYGLCDAIEVNEFDFFVEKQSGIVTYESNKIKDIKGTCN